MNVQYWCRGFDDTYVPVIVLHARGYVEQIINRSPCLPSLSTSTGSMIPVDVPGTPTYMYLLYMYGKQPAL